MDCWRAIEANPKTLEAVLDEYWYRCDELRRRG